MEAAAIAASAASAASVAAAAAAEAAVAAAAAPPPPAAAAAAAAVGHGAAEPLLQLIGYAQIAVRGAKRKASSRREFMIELFDSPPASYHA